MSEAIGLRVGEVAVDGSAVAHLHGKGRKDRSMPLWRTTANLIRNWKRRLDYAGEENFLFPNRGAGCMARSNVTQRLELAVWAAVECYPQLARRESELGPCPVPPPSRRVRTLPETMVELG
ncbi:MULTISPECIES: site-specific integrase [unclassified Mesorhizobium]|uniref:tyrosine-type recombinase/integrase n=1 Tax=unclassified Mesorhizobium TaxID=325217 RepID=UPI0003CFF235|nr:MULTISPECIES: tyrosine-type recombinase/integrase [unclassified Mesorhizobium]ESZ02003.1 hypothetical protein X736_31895 [Mesorhizobium sp. L2C089B000]WJI50372.1 tyrosine-type recombinase/integrase [Mesorhizobium sp. C089B]